MTHTMKTHTHNIVRSATLTGCAFVMTLVAACAKQSEPQATNSPPPKVTTPSPTVPAVPNTATSGLPTTPEGVASSLGINLADLQIPSQEEIDARISSQINAANADKAFSDLEKEIDEDTGG